MTTAQPQVSPHSPQGQSTCPSLPGPVVGVVGGGQLARMLAPAAAQLGVHLQVLASTCTDSAAQVIPRVTLGQEDHLPTLRRFASGCDVLTFDHEQVPTAHLRALQTSGITVHPGPHALEHAQDKIVLRQRLDALKVPQPAWQEVNNVGQIAQFAHHHGWPVILKTARGGYDGKGVWQLRDSEQAQQAWGQAQRAATVNTCGVLVEQYVAFERELAAQVARRPSGQVEVFPLVHTVQRNGVCSEVYAPASNVSHPCAQTATRLAIELADELDVVGLLTVELFDTGNLHAPVLVNELAMRPHNSGHWTIEGATVSQFEQHLRAVLDWPLAPVHLLHPATVMVNLLGGDQPDVNANLATVLADTPALHVHLYGKKVHPGRKIGHLTLTGHQPADLALQARTAAHKLITL